MVMMQERDEEAEVFSPSQSNQPESPAVSQMVEVISGPPRPVDEVPHHTEAATNPPPAIQSRPSVPPTITSPSPVPSVPARRTRGARNATLAPDEEEVVAKLMNQRCDMCIRRGSTSKCNRVWPACAKCIKEGTVGSCFKAVEDRVAVIRATRRAEELLEFEREFPPPEDATPPATPARSRHSHSRIPTTVHNSPSDHAYPAIRPSPISVSSRSSRSSRSASPRRRRGRLQRGQRARSPLSESRTTTVLDSPFGSQPGSGKATEDAVKLAKEEMARAERNLAAALAHTQAAPMHQSLGGLNVGQLGKAQQDLSVIASGVEAEPEFTFVPQTVIDLFDKKNWSTHVSFRYLTDAFCQQADPPSRKSVMRWDTETGSMVQEAVSLPDLGEASMSYLDWTRASQRFLAILRSLGNPNILRWERHCHFVSHHPSAWPLPLQYCITIRRRCVNDRTLDMGLFQRRIFESIRPEFYQASNEQLIRSLASANVAAPRARVSLPTHTASFGGASSSSHSVSAHQGPARCFACAGVGHIPKDCTATTQVSGKPLLITKAADGKTWELGGELGHTRAACAEATAIPPNPAVADPRRVVTPLIPDAWEELLREAGILDEFVDVPHGLRAGFRIGVTSALDSTTLHPNHKSATDNPDIILRHIAEEVAAGRYSGPFSPSDLQLRIGHFRASPLGVVDKPSSPGEFRIIQDFSFPRNHPSIQSVNSEIDSSDFPCTWGFFPDVVEVIIKLPPGSEASTFDIASAFRRIPVDTRDQPHMVVHWDGNCWVDHCVAFGAASSGGVFGRCGDALVCICRARGLGPVLKWVDDFLFFRSPISGTSPRTFAYSEKDIYHIAEMLGLPWKVAKTRLFATVFRYIGFDWDIPGRWVSIPPEKQAKFIIKLQNWLANGTTDLKSTESVLGSLIHCALAIPEGRSRVVGLARFTTSFSHSHKDRFAKRDLSARAKEDVTWWLARLMSGNCGSSIRPSPPLAMTKCYMDASTSFGVGIMIDDQYGMWKLKRGWKVAGRDIGWAEMIAIEFTLEALILRGACNASFILFSDNQGVIGALHAGRSRNDQQNLVLQRIMARSLKFNLRLIIKYIATDANPADAPSRGSPPPNSHKFSAYPPIDSSVACWVTEM